MAFNIIFILLLSLVINAILARKIGHMKGKIDDYEERLLIKDRPKIPSMEELQGVWNEKQFHVHTFYALFPSILRWRRRVIELSKKNSGDVPENVKRFLQFFTIDR